MPFKKFFPINYQPKISFDETNDFIYTFKNKFIEVFNKQAKFVSLSPIATLSDLNDQKFYRLITFDNYATSKLYQFESKHLKKINEKLINLDDKKINSCFTFTNVINRDSKMDHVNSLNEEILLISQKINKTTFNESQIFDIINELFDQINKIVEQVKEKKWKVNHLLKVEKFVPLSEIQKEYLGISIDQALTDYLIKNDFVFIKNVAFDLHEQVKELMYANLTKDHLAYSLYFLLDENNMLARILKVVLIENKGDLMSQWTVNIQINFSRLMMLILRKYHIAEVVSSSWNEEFILFVKENKIKIL